MVNLIDLSVLVRHGDGRLGQTVNFETPYRFDDVGWQGSAFHMFCHYGTHVDAPNHFIPGGDAIHHLPLSQLLGPAAVIDLSDHGDNDAVTGETLEHRGKHTEAGDIAILRTDWSDHHWGTDRFWTDGPYLAPDGADWLVKRRVKSVVYDFSEEYVVRTPGFVGEDCIIHHKILGQDIYNIEYVHNLSAITQRRVTLMALPLKLEGLDGSPARVVALEGVDLPKEFSLR